MQIKMVSFLPGFIWLIISFLVLIMPGSDLPSSPFFEMIYFDKWVHTGIFGLLCFFWGYPLLHQPAAIKKIFLVAILAALYGIAMEYVQKDFASQRNFDISDMVADSFGAFAAVYVLHLWRKKVI